MGVFFMGNKLKIIFFISLFLMTQVHAMSNPYRGGEVGILIKNNLPCFYIPDPKEKGFFSITTVKFSSRQKIEWRYFGNFEDEHPSKDNCIVWKPNKISEPHEVIMDIPYIVTFGAAAEKGYLSRFCLTQRNGVTILQKARGTECYDPPKSKWQSFKGLFH